MNISKFYHGISLYICRIIFPALNVQSKQFVERKI